MKVAACLMVVLVGCSGSNSAPTVELPAEALSVKEDWYTRFEIVATDPDGDNLSFSTYSTTGDVSVVSVRPTNDGAVTAVFNFDVGSNWYSDNEMIGIRVSDGIAETKVEIPVTITPVNDDPIGVMDMVATPGDTPVVIYASTLLANDTDVDAEAQERVADELSIAAVGKPNRGTVTLANGVITFVPEAGFVGTGRFEYTLTDGVEKVPVAVLVNIAGANAAPIAKVDEVVVMEGETLRLRPPALTANDIDDDAESLQIIAVSAPTPRGDIALDNGWVTFTPSGLETVTFTYTVTDGAATATGTVHVQIAPWI